MANESKHKHLEFIQGIVNRLANNSFQTKGWAVTIVAAIFALAANKDADGKLSLLVISFLPVFMFWILDGYFLWQERLFRELYKNVAKVSKEEEIDFQMNVGPYNKGRNTWVKSVFSKTLNIFYLSLLGIMIAIAVMIKVFEAS